jgi:hypothetical protein
MKYEMNFDYNNDRKMVSESNERTNLKEIETALNKKNVDELER